MVPKIIRNPMSNRKKKDKKEILNNNFIDNQGIDIILKHNKSPTVIKDGKINVPFQTSLGNDFLNLFANSSNSRQKYS